MSGPAAIDRLVVAAQGGDRQALHDLILTTQADVRLFAAARAPSLELAEEVVQAGYVTAYERLQDYQPRGTFLPWIKGIVLNRLREELRSPHRRALGSDQLDQVLAEACLERIDGDATRDSTGELERLHRCLQQLSPRAQSLLAKRYAEQIPMARLAQHFRQSEAAITGLLHRLRRALRQCIETAGRA